MPSGISIRQIRDAWVTTGLTKHLSHLKPIPRHWLRKRTIQDEAVKASKTKDRIKYWNIVPGDVVRVRGHKIKDRLEVAAINKISNRVILRQLKPSETEVCEHSLR
jgi:predicted thioredoxin/glutaredoxin